MKTMKDKSLPSKRTGIRTSEFWLSSVAALLGVLIASGVINMESSDMAAKIVGAACSILAALGYTVSRTMVKKADAESSD
tara:strand:+ start:1719 stop:1958 length:240 start_codon:yes stop_codon:yes gene_type:complete